MIAARPRSRSRRFSLRVLSVALACFAFVPTGAGSEAVSTPDKLNSVETIRSDVLPKLQLIGELRRQDYTFGATWSSDSKRLAAYSEYGNLVTVWSVNGQVLQEFHRPGIGDVTSALAFLSGNTEIVTPPTSNTAEDVAFSVFDIATGAVVRELPGPHPEWHGRANWAHHLVSSPDQSLLAAAFGPSSQPVILYSTKDWSKIAEVPVAGPNGPKALAFSADGRYLAIALALEVMIYDIAARQVLRQIKAFSLEAGECCVSAVAFNPDASLVAVATAAQPASFCGPRCVPTTPETPIRIFRVGDGSTAASSPKPLWRVWNMGWSRDGRFVAFVARDALYLWHPSHPQEQQMTNFHVDSTSLAFAPNGRWLAACDGRSVNIFDVTK